MRRPSITTVGPEDKMVVRAVTRAPFTATPRAPPYQSSISSSNRSLSWTSASLGFWSGLSVRVESDSVTSMPGPITGVRPARDASRSEAWCARNAAVAATPATVQPATASKIHGATPLRNPRSHDGGANHDRPREWTSIAMIVSVPPASRPTVHVPGQFPDGTVRRAWQHERARATYHRALGTEEGYIAPPPRGQAAAEPDHG